MQLDRNKTQQLIDAGKARGLSGEDVLNGLIERGYEPEGIDVAKARGMLATKQAEQGGLVQETGDDLAGVGRDISAAVDARGEKLNEIDAAQAQGQQGPVRSLVQKLGQGAGFAGDAIGSVFKGAAKAILPQAAEEAVGGGIEKAIAWAGDQDLVKEGVQLHQELKQRDPALARDLEAALNIAMLGVDVASVGVGGQVAKGAAKVAGEAAEGVVEAGGKAAALPAFGASEVSGALTGTSGETVRQAFAAARAGGEELKQFTDALRKRTTPEQLVNRLREGTDQLSVEKSAKFGQMLDTIGDTRVPTADVLPGVVEDLGKIGVKVGEDKQLDFSGSKFRTVPEAQKKLQRLYDEAVQLGDEQDIRGIDTSRQALGALLLAGDDASARTANMAITGAINRVRAAGTKVEGYQDALTQFGDDAEFINEISRSLSSGDKATIDTAYRKLATSLKTNNEQRRNLLQELDDATGGYIMSSVAGQQLSEELPRGIFKQIAAGVAAGSALSGGISATFLPALVFASPRVTGEVLRALGVAQGKVDELVSAFSKVKSDLDAVPVKNPGDEK
jgi:hypothetical protein